MYFSPTVYRPDPYVAVQVLGTPNGIKKTNFVSSSSDPIWEETLEFYLDAEKDRIVGRNDENTIKYLD